MQKARLKDGSRGKSAPLARLYAPFPHCLNRRGGQRTSEGVEAYDSRLSRVQARIWRSRREWPRCRVHAWLRSGTFREEITWERSNKQAKKGGALLVVVWWCGGWKVKSIRIVSL